jgi:hypothetical protein
MSARLYRWFGVWCAFTLAWGAAVIAAIAVRIGDQVSASEALARDIAALDGGGTALVTRWQDMAALVLEHRASALLEVTLLPPLAVVALAIVFLAWRARRPSRSAYSAAVRRPSPSRFK